MRRSDGPTVWRSDGPTLKDFLAPGRAARSQGRSVAVRRSRTRGATLLELLVVLVMLGLFTTLGALSLVALRPPVEAARLDTLRSARARAIRTGAAVVIWVDSSHLRFLPDGRVLGGPVDPLTGASRDAR